MSPIGTVEKPATKKAVKKTTKAPATKKAKSAAAAHPPYFQMIKEALLALGEKGGSSPHAIAKYMEEKHKSVLPDNFRKMLALQLKNSASKGKLTKVKASYKLSDAAKKDKPAVKKAKKPAARASADVATVKKGVKKPVAKKVKKTPVKAKKAKKTPVKAKKPKSVKSPAAKKARKVAA